MIIICSNMLKWAAKIAIILEKTIGYFKKILILLQKPCK
jgi:hypothetical protein